MQQVVCFAKSWHIADPESAPLKNSAQLKIWLCAVDGVHNPLNLLNRMKRGIPHSQGPQSDQNPLSAAIDLGQLNGEPLLIAAECTQHCGRPNPEDSGLAVQH